MYFPLLRGRQFELIALRELIGKHLIGNKIIPIIEPVKPTSTLTSTLAAYRENNAPIAVIRNPQVGDFISKLNDTENKEARDKFFSEIEKDGFISSFYINNKSRINRDSLLTKKIQANQCIAICDGKDSVSQYTSIFGEEGALYTLIPNDRTLKRTIKEGKVIFTDHFHRKERNTDYLLNEDELFTDDNVYFSQDGFVGFSDYSIVGNEYSESGFAPYAVVIHIIYLDDDKSLRIHHFVSDSNEDINDPANKFYEALHKFHQWNQAHQLQTFAIQELENLYETKQYPGLGSIKKLSIMHHLELVNQYLEGNDHDHM